MECGWDSPEQISACLHLAKRWFDVLTQLVGLGTFALIGLLIWLFRRLRQDLSKWEDEAKRANELRHLADEAAKHAGHSSDLAQREAERARNELEDLKRIGTSSADELRREFAGVQARLSETKRRLEGALQLTAGGTGRFWSQPVGNRFADYERQLAGSIPILMLGNQKGGVGKTTTMTNLAAAFVARGERVLTVDLDYQGSHSGLMQLQEGLGTREPESLIDFLFEDALDPNWQKLCLRRVSDSLHYIPAFYNFELVERRVEYHWALGTADDDVRYRLARVLFSPDVQEKFDRVLIDAPAKVHVGIRERLLCGDPSICSYCGR